MPHDTPIIRQLLTAAFSDDALTTFCYDHFRQVSETFSSGQSKLQKIQYLIEHCERQNCTDKLLACVKQQNPAKYKEFEARLGGSEASQKERERYFNALREMCANLQFAGIPIIYPHENAMQFDLSQIFILPNVVVSQQEGQMANAPIKGSTALEKQTQPRYPNRPIIAKELLKQERRIVLLGAPGCGKTTLLKYFALAIVEGQQSEWLDLPPAELLPIFVPIREFAYLRAQKRDVTLLSFLYHKAEGLTQKALPSGFFEGWLETGQAMLLLDGLDEIVDVTARH